MHGLFLTVLQKRFPVDEICQLFLLILNFSLLFAIENIQVYLIEFEVLFS